MKIIDINSIPRPPIDRKQVQTQEGFIPTMKWHYILLFMGFLSFTSILSICIWIFYQEKKDADAQQDMFQAAYYFEAEDYDKALKGDGTHQGFLTIVAQYPYTKSANLARFYIGSIYMHQKEYDHAIRFLKKFRSRDLLLPARAWCLIGDAYSEQKDYTQAATYYMKAARYKANSQYTPDYLKKAALSFEANQQFKEAYDCYQAIVTRYPKCRYYDLAIKEANRVSLLI